MQLNPLNLVNLFCCHFRCQCSTKSVSGGSTGGLRRSKMPKGGLEPPCPFEHNALNVACLPISPLRRVGCGQALYYCIPCGLSSAFAPFSWEDFYLFPRKLCLRSQCRRERLRCLSSI